MTKEEYFEKLKNFINHEFLILYDSSVFNGFCGRNKIYQNITMLTLDIQNMNKELQES